MTQLAKPGGPTRSGVSKSCAVEFRTHQTLSTRSKPKHFISQDSCLSHL
jgi:hypothetical protein